MNKLIFLCFLPVFITAQTPVNQLSAMEKRQGWVLLFDGNSLAGWRTYKNLPDNSWEIINGQLHCRSDSEGVTQRADLVTIKSYASFEIQFEWRVEKGANSGLLYHVQESGKNAYETGPEYQMIDDMGYSGKLEDWQKSGADYAMHPPAKLMSKPTGEYNHTRMIVDGNHVTQWLNGAIVTDFYAWTPEWEKLKADGKWKDYPDYGLSRTGLIDIQDHGGGVWIKNVKIREIR